MITRLCKSYCTYNNFETEKFVGVKKSKIYDMKPLIKNYEITYGELRYWKIEILLLQFYFILFYFI